MYIYRQVSLLRIDDVASACVAETQTQTRAGAAGKVSVATQEGAGKVSVSTQEGAGKVSVATQAEVDRSVLRDRSSLHLPQSSLAKASVVGAAIQDPDPDTWIEIQDLDRQRSLDGVYTACAKSGGGRWRQGGERERSSEGSSLTATTAAPATTSSLAAFTTAPATANSLAATTAAPATASSSSSSNTSMRKASADVWYDDMER
jgi:hypothetical protein